MSHDIAMPVKAKFFTKGTKVVFGIMVAGMLAYAYRLLFGIGAATNLDDQWPWGIWIAIDGRSAFHADPKRNAAGPGSAAVVHDEVRAPMTGKVVAVQVQVGETVAEGALLAILEAMKMEYRLVAPRAGQVEAVHCRAGELVDLGQPLVTLMEAAEAARDSIAPGEPR